MNILVTGGAGFIGSNLVDELVERGDNVIIIDDLSSGHVDNIKKHLDKNTVEFVNGSILDRHKVEKLVSRVSLVYHLAAIVGVEKAYESPGNVLVNNIEGTRVVLDSCYRNNIKVVMASSSEVYGKTQNVPIYESSDCILGSTYVLRWSYAVSKIASEHLGWSLKNDIPVIMLRYFNIYGPRLDPNGYYSFVASIFIKQALTGAPITVYGDGYQTRSFTHIKDTVKATIAASSLDKSYAMNICRPLEISIYDLAVLIKKLTGSDSKIINVPHPGESIAFEEVRRRIADITKARELIGFNPKIGLEKGLIDTIDWMCNKHGYTRKKAA